MNEQQTPEEVEFQARFNAAWDEIRQFRRQQAKPVDVESNPQHRLAPEFFQIYLEKRPSRIASRAIQSAFAMWGNLPGVSDDAKDALTHIDYDEDVWEGVAPTLLRVFNQDEDSDHGLALLEELAEKVIPLKSRTALQFELSGAQLDGGAIEKARRGFEQIVGWDASEWHVRQARGYIYEFDHLNVGQPAPHFRLQDVDGNAIDFADYARKTVVLHFWGTTCGACPMIYPHLRKIVEEFPVQKFALIGISDDKDLETLREGVVKEEFTWPQICEGSGWDDTIYRLYNVTAIPAAYVIDASSNIAAKIVGGDRGDELESVVRSLVT